MTTYQVIITETVTYTIEVDASTPEQAIARANEEVDDWGVEPSSNLPPDDIERLTISASAIASK